MTSILWGNSYWFFIHYTISNFEIYVKDEERKSFENLIQNLQFLLPCLKCREHIKKNLILHPLKEEMFENKLKLLIWSIQLHNMVNLSSNKDELDLEDSIVEIFCDKYSKSNFELKENITFDEINELYKKSKLNKLEDNIMNINDICNFHKEKREKEIIKNKEIEEITRKTTEMLESLAKCGKVEEIYTKSDTNFDFNIDNKNITEKHIEKKMDTIDIEKLIKKFEAKYNESNSNIEKRRLLEGMNLIFVCM
jgi:hypothetical protein